jgi:UDP-N-acetylmuramoyl-tripeptide--D-alanyl-D-alanine ligase
MKTMSLEEIRAVVGGEFRPEGRPLTVVGVTTDTSAAKSGEVFIALKGQNHDAHKFLDQAAGAGCVSAIVRRGASIDPSVVAKFPGGLIGVDDTQAALEALGAYHRGLVKASVIGVTGSNGKTTVKRMIHHVLSSRPVAWASCPCVSGPSRPCPSGRSGGETPPGRMGGTPMPLSGERLKGSCSPKSFNNNIGLPLTLLGVAEDDAYVVCEMGSNAPGEIAMLARIARPDVAVITSVGYTHLEKLGSIEGVAREKASILAATSPKGPAIVNGDSEPLAAALEAFEQPLRRFGFGPGNDYRVTAYEACDLTCRFRVNGRVWVSLPLSGRHMAANALCAMVVAEAFGIGLEESAQAMASFEAVDGRLRTVPCGAVTVIDDTYNANPSSLAAAADVLSSCKAGRRVMVVGDMKELGDASADLHRAAGADLASRAIDLLIAVGPMGRYIAIGAGGDARRSRHFESVEQAAAELPGLLREGDLVLVKGSRTMAMERLIQPIREAFGAGSK